MTMYCQNHFQSARTAGNTCSETSLIQTHWEPLNMYSLVESCSQTLSAWGEAGNEDPIQEEYNNATFAQLSLPPSPPHCHQPGDPLLHVYVKQQHINKKLPTLTTTFRV